MAVHFHPLPPEMFPPEAQPRVQRFNRELRDLFGLEGTLTRARTNTKRSDDTIASRRTQTVNVTRVAGLEEDGSPVSQLTQNQIDILTGVANLIWAVGFGPVLSVVDNLGATRTYRATLVWQTSVGRPQLQWVEVT